MATKTDKLRAVRDDVWNLTQSPLYPYRTKMHYYPVLGEGNHDAKIMFIGEAPGENEAKTGRPFCGAAGRILTELLASINMKREDVYISNIVKDRPPGNRDPFPDEIALYAPFLERQIEIIQPQVIVTLGRFSMNYMLETYDLPQKGMPISTLHGQPLKLPLTYGTITFLPLYHPAVALYNATSKKTLLSDIAQLASL